MTDELPDGWEQQGTTYIKSAPHRENKPTYAVAMVLPVEDKWLLSACNPGQTREWRTNPQEFTTAITAMVYYELNQ